MKTCSCGIKLTLTNSKFIGYQYLGLLRLHLYNCLSCGSTTTLKVVQKNQRLSMNRQGKTV